MKPNKLPRGSLLTYETKDGQPRYRAKSRDSTGKQCAPTIGPAWLTKADGQWIRRSGRLRDGFFDEHAAYLRLAELVEARKHEIELIEDHPPLTFDQLAAAWLDYLSRGGRAKPSTLKDYGLLVAYPRTAIRGKRPLKARIMERFADREVASITTDEIASLLDALVIAGLSPRNVNKHREALHSIFAFGMKPGAFKLPSNPVVGTEEQREDGPGAIETFSRSELAEIERVALVGEHRERPAEFYGPGVFVEWRRFNEQDAAIFMIAARTGMRQGELRALSQVA